MAVELTREELELIVHALHGHAIHMSAHGADNHQVNALADKIRAMIRKEGGTS